MHFLKNVTSDFLLSGKSGFLLISPTEGGFSLTMLLVDLHIRI